MTRLAGPSILARTMSVATRRGKADFLLQYHSRSDHHSKLICWTILFDLLRECDAIQRDAREGRIGVGVNHVLVGPINKTLDLVICRLPRTSSRAGRRTLAELGEELGVVLDEGERNDLRSLPPLPLEGRDDASEVAVALEAKACMTAHSKSLPRLHAEILATGFLAKQAAPNCVTVSHTLVNGAPYFVSASETRKRNLHTQPQDARGVLDMLGRAIPRSTTSAFGYDAIGATVVDCRNDGTPVSCSEADPAPSRTDPLHYERMMMEVCGAYRTRFRGD